MTNRSYDDFRENIPQKLYILVLALVLAVAPALSLVSGPSPWVCSKAHFLGHDDLPEMHHVLDNLFGTRGLTVASGQCYVAKCKQKVFAFCNWDGKTRTEDYPMRKYVAESNPGTKVSGCIFQPKSNPALVYLFGDDTSYKFRGNIDVRHCSKLAGWPATWHLGT